METNSPIPTHGVGSPASDSNQNLVNGEFAVGATVIYPSHGKCSVTAIESRQLNGQTIRFYRLEVQKSPLSRSTRREPEIFLPVSTARDRGLRAPITSEEAQQVLAVLASREYYFSAQEPFAVAQPKLEACIRNEGAVGMAKVASYLHVMIKRVYVPASEMVRYQETIQKFLYRELSEALNEQVRSLEERVTKSMRQKLIPDT